MEISTKSYLALGNIAEPDVRDLALQEKGKEVEELASQFESIFMNLLLKSMRSTVGKSELMNGGNAEEIYQSMLDNEYAIAMAKSSKSSFSEALKQQLLDAMGQSPKESADRKQGMASYQKFGATR